MLAKQYIYASVFPASLQLGGVMWLVVLDEMYGFSTVSSPIEACIEIRLPQEWNETALIKELGLSDQEMNVCCVNSESLGLFVFVAYPCLFWLIWYSLI